MRKLDLAGWVAELERQVVALPVAIESAAVVIGETGAAIAKAKISHYQPAVGEFPAWEPLAESTLAEKSRLGYAPPDNPLLRTGEVRDSITSHVLAAPGEVITVIHSDDEVLHWQEGGTDRMPPRPVIGPAMLEVEPIAQRELGNVLVATLTGDAYRPSNIGFVAFQEAGE